MDVRDYQSEFLLFLEGTSELVYIFAYYAIGGATSEDLMIMSTVESSSDGWNSYRSYWLLVMNNKWSC